VATDPSRATWGISTFAVTKWATDPSIAARIGFGHSDTIESLDGVRVGKKEGLSGWRTSGTREQFGQKLREFQPVKFRLSDMATDIEAGGHLWYRTGGLKERGSPVKKEAATAKLFCSELAMRATLQAIQFLGGAGYTSDYPV